MVAIVALVLEGGLRLEAAYDQARTDRRLDHLATAPRPARGATVALTDIVRPSSDPRRVYELLPDLDVVFASRVTTNSAGFRGREIAPAKPPGTVRIVGLGDSVMFGWGLADDQNFLAVLGQRLAAQFPVVAWETLNTAVPGYDTANEVATLESAASSYAPDLVVVHFVSDDMDPPKFIRRRAESFALDRAFLVDRIERDVTGGTSERRGALVASVLRRNREPGAVLTDDVRAMAGPEAYARSMTELRRLADQHRMLVVAVAHPRFPREVRRLLGELGISAVETEQTVARYVREHRITDARDRRLVMSPVDPHPTALVHGLIADALVADLVREGIVARLVERAAPSAPGR